MIHPKSCKQMLALLLIGLILLSMTPKCAEALKDYGARQETMNAPLGYEAMTMALKYPSMIEDETYKSEIDALMDDSTSFNQVYFNKNENRRFYSQGEMENDFKYFNNASNLSLYHSFNNT